MRLNKAVLDLITEQIKSKSFHKTELYKLLKTELTKIGNWQAKPRGNPAKGYKVMISKTNQEQQWTN